MLPDVIDFSHTFGCTGITLSEFSLLCVPSNPGKGFADLGMVEFLADRISLLGAKNKLSIVLQYHPKSLKVLLNHR